MDCVCRFGQGWGVQNKLTRQHHDPNPFIKPSVTVRKNFKEIPNFAKNLGAQEMAPPPRYDHLWLWVAVDHAVNLDGDLPALAVGGLLPRHRLLAVLLVQAHLGRVCNGIWYGDNLLCVYVTFQIAALCLNTSLA